jgi:hypothetical protein
MSDLLLTVVYLFVLMALLLRRPANLHPLVWGVVLVLLMLVLPLLLLRR